MQDFDHPENGMVIDFGNIKRYMMDIIDAIFDHAFVVSVADPKPSVNLPVLVKSRRLIIAEMGDKINRKEKMGEVPVLTPPPHSGERAT